MITKNEVSALFQIDLPDDLSKKEQREIKKEIGEYLLVSILDYVGSGKSPVSGQGSFKKLNKEYAKDQKGGDTLPNLDLFGDMLDSLKFKVTDKGIEYGIYDKKEAIKAYAHNTGFEGHPYLESESLKRQFIPNKGQKLKREIVSGINEIIEDFLDAREENS